MLIVENTETYGWEAAIRGMRNPMNSWDKSDSFECNDNTDGSFCVHCKFANEDYTDCDRPECGFIVGKNDLALMKSLAKAGTDHGKFLRMITVTCDITAPLYWWKEFDTYKVGTVANSCSTMHKIQAKEFTLDDFSHEHIGEGMATRVFEECFENIIDCLNEARLCFLETKDKQWWWQMIQLLPSSYNQRRTVQMNYQVLKNIYHSRRNHKLDEWHTLCKWIETLPYSELITE